VELGAGLTQRTVEWALDRGVDSVDVDLPAMIAVKRSALAKLPSSLQARLAAKHRTLAADVLAPEADAVLDDALAGATKPVVLAEGLVSYFDDAGRTKLFATVAAALARNGGGHFIADLHTADAQAKMGGATKTLRSAIRVITRRKQALAPFADEAALGDALLHAGFAGWRIARREDYVAQKPALARTRSPAHIVDAWVG
jgi:O-methyltransferase involved in polyketide biosynthesis